MQPITVLTIAGSDSGGGAGVQADLRTFAAFAVHGTTALTAITAQNTLGVTSVFNLDPELVAAQVLAVVGDLDVRATKTGMLATPSTVERVARLADDGLLPHLVVDPVLVSSTGHVLMEEGGVETYREALLPFAEIVTPNLREAALLAGYDVRDVHGPEDMTALAYAILAFGPAFVLVKGGHFTHASTDPSHSPDVLVGAGEVVLLDAERVTTTNDHGTGCSLAAAIACGLGLGRPLADSVRDAKSFVLAALIGGAEWRLGRGHGPIDHLGWDG